MNPLAPFFAYLARRRALRALQDAERKRQAIIRQIDYRRGKHMAFRPLFGDLRRATEDSLRANLAGRA